VFEQLARLYRHSLSYANKLGDLIDFVKINK
jgi:hypothetical protein